MGLVNNGFQVRIIHRVGFDDHSSGLSATILSWLCF